MRRGIDHLVLCVNDLKKARAAYETLGFTMTPEAQHPFGTGNTLAQLGGCFLEVLAVTCPEDIPEHRTDASGEYFSFAAFNRDFLATREGMSMLVLDSTDEVADREEFVKKDLHVFAPFEFQRQAKMPGGDEVTVGFSLTFLVSSALDGMGFFTCRQWRPDVFWKPAYQRHANGALSVDEVFMICDDTDEATTFLAAFADAPSAQGEAERRSVDTTRGRLTAMSADAFDAQFPGAGRATRSPRFGGFALRVEDTDKVRSLWSERGIPFHDGKTGPWLDPAVGLGCVIEMREH